MKTKYKPKFKKGDVVRFELIVESIDNWNNGTPFYKFETPKNFICTFNPDSKPFDKIAKLVKKPAKKKAKPCP